MTKDEALKLALEALKQIDEAMPFPVAKLAQAAIKEALAQPERLAELGWQEIDCPICGGGARAFPKPEQEPVEWLTGCPSCGMDSCDCDEGAWNPPTQRTWVGLTDEEVEMLVKNQRAGPREQIRYIEAKLKEKNT